MPHLKKDLNRTGTVFEVQRFSLHDGPGTRTTVFLKGCPLKCLWCHNPEGLSTKPQLRLKSKSCIECHSCELTCPQGATTAQFQAAQVDRDACDDCGLCTEVCPSEGLEMIGKVMTAEDVIAIVERDVDYFNTSGGGMTLSGGEALAQPQFALALLRIAKQKGIHTCIETSCFTSKNIIESVRPYVDTFLVDIKAFDDTLHHQLTGVHNNIILSNIEHLSASGVDLTLRLPTIPGCNDHDSELKAKAKFIHTLSHQHRVELLPYHQMGESKHQQIGMNQQPCSTPPDAQTVAAWIADYQQEGVEVHSPLL